MARKKKEDVVAKVAKETGVQAEDLNRLPVEALDKLDAIVPDEDLLGSPSELPTVVSEQTATEESNSDSEPSSLPNAAEAVKVLKGYHPITGAEVWA